MASSSTTSARPEWEPEDICTAGCVLENELMSAFHEIAPSTSSTSSTLIQKPCFDVFINHRGPDVKKTLASRIYKILSDMKVTAFLDSEQLEYGDFLPTTLEAAIRGATLHIAIFSKSYAESVWCLAELSCMLKSGAKIVPIFYYVEPHDLRYVAQRKGIYADVFDRHKKKHRYSAEKIREREYALYKVSFYSGEIIRNNDDEGRLFKNIVNVVLKEISNVPLLVAKHPVGLNAAVEDFENAIQLIQANEGVKIVGIWGMGGSGKTTLAKELYNTRRSIMERSSFIFDIREAKGMLQKKQIELLNGLGVDVIFDNVEQGKAILARHLRLFKVLIVMDDVDHVDQLDALIPIKERLGKGSLIIVTIREREVLTTWGISSIYKMRALDPQNAKQLFCWHAFLQPSPLDGFEMLVHKFLQACDGLPLSLKVFGAQLHGNFSKEYWESLFHKISRILSEDIKGKLKISYDALDHEEKEAFLDIACFFIGEKNSLAIEVWNGLGWSGLYIWKKLLNKCLVDLDIYNNHISMHDHLRDLGREIADQQSPSRLWLSKQIIIYGKQTKKTNDIRGIKVAQEVRWPFKEESQPNISGEILLLAPYLVGLKLLVVEGDLITKIIGEVSRELIWLRWSDSRQRNLPAQLSLKKLRILELHEDYKGEHHLEELWGAESDAPMQLRELVISNCCKFQRFPNSIGCLSELKRIVIKDGNNIWSLPEEFCCLRSLEYLFLSHAKISSLPNNFGDLTNLQYLNLSGSWKLRRLPITFRNLMLLKYLNLEECSQLMLISDNFQNITELEFLSLSQCKQIEELPRHITNQVSLKELYLDGMLTLRKLPVKINELSRLRKMKIGNLHYSYGGVTSTNDGSILKSLPDSLGNLSSLIELEIKYCPNLESLPTSLGNLSSLTHLSIVNCPKLESLPNSLGDMFSLTYLSIAYCPQLKCLPSSVRCLDLLGSLRISTCPISQIDFETGSLTSAFRNLKMLLLQHTDVRRISIPEDRYPCLEWLILDRNDHLTEIQALPVNLEELDIRSSPKLDVIPSFAPLTSLKSLEVRDCDRIEKIEGLKYCTRLEKLQLHTCWEVPGIESLEQMGKLRMVELRANKVSAIESCIQSIQKWPDEIIICTRAVPDASSHVDSFKHGLSPNLSVVDSFSNKNLWYRPELLPNSFSNRSGIMLCYVMNCDDCLQMKIDLDWCGEMASGGDRISSMGIDEGAWALIAVLPQRSEYLATEDISGHVFRISAASRGWTVEVERGLALTGDKKELQGLTVEALRQLTY